MENALEKSETKPSIESFPIFEGGIQIGVREEKKDEEGIVEETWRDSNGVETSKVVYVKDESGKIVKEEWFKDGVPEGFYSLEYDEKGKFIGRKWNENKD